MDPKPGNVSFQSIEDPTPMVGVSITLAPARQANFNLATPLPLGKNFSPQRREGAKTQM